MKFSRITVGQLSLLCIVVVLLGTSGVLLSFLSLEGGRAGGGGGPADGAAASAVAKAKAAADLASLSSGGGGGGENADDDRPWTVLVMGMHHSGTSLLARILMEAGLWGGERHEFLLQKDAVVADPPKFWERKDIVALTQGLIRQQKLNSSVPWVTGFGFRSSRVNRQARHKFLVEFRRVMGELARHGSHVIKEPRLAITGALWRAAVPTDRTVCVIVFRHPLHVAAGLRQRPRNRAFSMDQWVSLWEKYHLGAMQSCEGLATVYVSHAAFAMRPRETVNQLVAVLRNHTGLTGERPGQPQQQQLQPPSARWLKEFLPAHKHQPIEPGDFDSLTSMQALLYRTMETVAVNEDGGGAGGGGGAGIVLPAADGRREVHDLAVPALHVDIHTAEEREADRASAAAAAAADAAAAQHHLAFKVVLKAQAVSNGQDVLVIPSNTVFSGMARNLVCSLRRLGVSQFVALGLDDYFCDAMSGMGVSCYFDRSFGRGVATLERWTMSSESDYFHILWQKMTYVQEVLDLGFNVLLMDADVVWLNDAHRHIRQLPGFADTDMFIQSDARPWDPMKQDWVCAGFFYMKSNLRTRLFVAQVLALMHQFGAPDQDVFQLLLTGSGQNFAFPTSWQTKIDAERHDEATNRWLLAEEMGLKWATLDEVLFTNGGRFTRDMNKLETVAAKTGAGGGKDESLADHPDVVPWADRQIVHVNMRSFEKKKTSLMRANMWFIHEMHPDRCRSSSDTV